MRMIRISIGIFSNVSAMKTDKENQEQGASAPRSGEISSTKLMADTKELVIKHNNERYVLRITGNNKLILTK
ncbi:MAG: hemin uptake protein HemP [Candidatus Pseudothioglobus sp.]|jgi:hemin uptake protein HemP